jgi:hypothetical protein
MMTSQISASHSTFSLKQVSGSENASQRKTGTAQGKYASGDNQSESVVVNKRHADFTKVQTLNATFNSVAENLQTADKAMEAIGKEIDKMSGKLETHIKNYPPFLPGSEERMQLLKSFQAFRKQIDEMTIPPDNTDVSKIIADPSVNPEAGGWEISFGENGPHRTITPKEVHTGPTGLNIPELPEGATDDMINDAISKIGNAKEILEKAKADLYKDISDIAQLKIQTNQQDDIKESAVEFVSREAKHALAKGSGMSITEIPGELNNIL